MAELRIEKLTKLYDGRAVVDDVNLTVPTGNFCIFLGPSGCGKSTTLNCVAGLADVTSGRILLGDRDITRLQPHERDIAMVFQSALLYPHLSAHENIRLSLRGAALDRVELEKRVDRVAVMLDIKDLLGKKPAAMSGGERQRVAIAKAIVRDPSAFLLDEPLSALDAALRQSLRTELVHLQKQLGVTTIFVTHDQVEAMTMGDMIVVMNNGRIEQVGSPQDVYERPATRFVAGFVGAPPMNFFPGYLARDGDRFLFRTGNSCFVLTRSLIGADIPRTGEIELGVRPQHILLDGAPTDGALPATVYAVERLGKENVMVVEDEAKRTFRALTAPTFAMAIGDRVFLRPDVSKALLFPSSN